MNSVQQQDFDVLIIGGGIIGLSIARELKKRSVPRVAILERNLKCGSEASNVAAGMLAPQSETHQADDFLRFCQQSRDLYPNFAAELLDETNVDIELEKSGTLYLNFYESDSLEIERRFDWQKSANLPVEKLTRQEILSLEPNVSDKVSGGLLFPFDWQVENKKLVAALDKSQCESQFVGQRVEKFLFENSKICGVKTETNQFYARKVIIAAGSWSSFSDCLPNSNFNIEVKPIRGQILIFKTREKTISHVIQTKRGYIVPRRDNRILVGATVEDVGFRRESGSAAMISLFELKDEILSNSIDSKFLDNQLSFRPKTADGLPLLGEFPRDSGLFWATGHYRNGILLAPITAKLIADSIVDNDVSPFLEIFNPSRFQNNL